MQLQNLTNWSTRPDNEVETGTLSNPGSSGVPVLLLIVLVGVQLIYAGLVFFCLYLCNGH